MLQPKKTKYRKIFKPRSLPGPAVKGTRISFGEYGLRADESGHVSNRQIEAARRAIVHFIKRGGRVWIRLFPDMPITKKPPETRMGGGKGDVHHWVAVARAGRIMFEMSGVDEATAREALRLASHKLAVKSSFIKKNQ
jgi:large subunit ribosomal protein L16